MLLTAGLLVLGGVAALSMVMMVGNVLSKSPYGKTWAMLGGLSVLLAGGLVILQVLVPSVDAMGFADEEASKKTQDTQKEHAVSTETEGESATEAEAESLEDATSTDSQTTDAAPTGSTSLEDLSVLTAIMDLLKQGKALPPEYLALLPDGAPGVIAEQSKAQATPISKPLQSQLVSLNRSQGTSYKPSNSYVPSTKPATTPAKSGQVVAAPNKPSNKPADSGTTQPAESSQPGVPTPSRPPVTSTQPAPVQTPPPAAEPPVSTSAALIGGGLVKSVLGKSKDSVEDYFKYNQFLGQEGSTLRYLRGSQIVEVTFTNSNFASQVLVRFDPFPSSGMKMADYANYMSSVAGLTQAKSSSGDNKNLYFNGVYPGASTVHFHIDTNSNYGYVRASY